jgi:hypothetical protein
MGHIGNSLGLRLSLNRQWRGSIDSSLILRQYYSWLVSYFDMVFSSDFLKQRGFIFSHCVLQQFGDKLDVDLFVQDAFLEMYGKEFHGVLYPSKWRLKRSRGKKQRLFFQKRADEWKERSKKVFIVGIDGGLLSDLRRKRLVFRNLLERKKSKLRKKLLKRGYFSFKKASINKKKDLQAKKRSSLLLANRRTSLMLKEKRKILTKRRYLLLKKGGRFVKKKRLLVFLRQKYYQLLGNFFREQLEKMLNVSFYSLSIHPLGAHFMTSDVILRYMTKRLEQGYYLVFLAKTLLKGYARSALGIRFKCSGRFTRSQRARTYIFKRGRAPLNTFDVKFDYNYKSVRLKYGLCGVKLWIAHL